MYQDKHPLSKSKNRKSAQHLISSHHQQTLEKLQSLKPLRESQCLKTSMISTGQQIAKTPARQQENRLSNSTNKFRRSEKSQERPKSRNLQEQGLSQQDRNITQTIDLYSSVDSRKYISSGHAQIEDEEDLKSPQQLGVAIIDQSKAHSFIQSQNNPEVKTDANNLSLYVVKTKKNQSKQQSKQNQTQKLNHTIDKSQKSTSKLTIEKILQNSVAKKKDRFSAVKSKVKSNMRSKTPKNAAPQLTKQQMMDQEDRRLRREEQIIQLQNEVHKIRNDLEFKQSNKEMLLDSYKNTRPVTHRKGTEHVQSENGDQQDSTDESVNRVNLQSKKQFSDLEYMIQNHKFSDKYYDKVYLEICGFKDLEACKSQFLEKTKSQNNNITICKRDFQKVSAQVVQDDIITGSVTFFERRADKFPPNNQKSSQNVVLSAEYQSSQLPTPPDEFYENEKQSINPSQDVTILDDQSQESKVIQLNKVSVMRPSSSILQEFLNKREQIREENQKLVEDFDKIYQEINDYRKTSSQLAFYEAIHEYDYEKKQLDNAIYRDEEGNLQLAQSPTKRLICMKNSSVEHIKQIRDHHLVPYYQNPESQTHVYLASPERAYVVKSSEKIDYNLAYKKPLKFYEEALKGSVTKHKIQQNNFVSPGQKYEKQSTLGSSCKSSQKSFHQSNLTQSASKLKRRKDHEVFSIVSKKNTSRPHNVRINFSLLQKIDQKIKQKIEEKLAGKFGAQLTQQVLQALEEANLNQDLQQLIEKQEEDQRQQARVQKTMSVKSIPRNQQFDDEARYECGSADGQLPLSNPQLINRQQESQSHRTPHNRDSQSKGRRISNQHQ